jgi:signal transduction histidine kinase
VTTWARLRPSAIARLRPLTRLRRSLGLRLMGLFVLLALATTLVFLGGMQKALSAGWSVVFRPLVVDYVDRLAAELGSPPDPARAAALVQRLPLSIRIDGPQVQYDSHPQRRAWEPRHRHDGHGDDVEHAEGGWWLLTRTTADGHHIRFGLGDAAWQNRPRAIGGFTLALLLALTALAYGVVRRLFKPIDEIRAGAERFGRGDFATPIPQRRGDELGELAGQVNTMAAELKQMLDAQRGLLLAISHELRSPLTRARLNAELVEGNEARDALLRDLGQMRDLIHDLLESERLSVGHGALQREPTELPALARSVLAEHFAGRAVALEVEGALPAIDVDRARLRLLLRNLLDNAFRHGAAEPPPCLALRAQDGGITLSVRDFGPGVPEPQLASLAQAFVRIDAARQRSTGGVGLGLYLCRLVAQAHGGRLVLRNAAPGLEASAWLPAATPAAVSARSTAAPSGAAPSPRARAPGGR